MFYEFLTTIVSEVQSSGNLGYSFFIYRQKVWSIFFEKYCKLLIYANFTLKQDKDTMDPP